MTCVLFSAPVGRSESPSAGLASFYPRPVRYESLCSASLSFHGQTAMASSVSEYLCSCILVNLHCALDFASKNFFNNIKRPKRLYCPWKQIYIRFSQEPVNAITPV